MGTKQPTASFRQDERTGHWTIRFRYAGQRYHRTSGTKNLGEAQAEAARIIAEVMRLGRAPLPRGSGAPPMPDLLGAWVDDYAAHHAAQTTREIERYVENLFIVPFPTLASISEASLSAYATARLRVVKAATVKKELSALSMFLEWCRLNGIRENPPRVPKIQARALGTANTKRVQRRVHMPDELVERFLRKLPPTAPPPKKGPRRGDDTYPLRDVYSLIWETGLRIGTIERLDVVRHWTPGAELLTITADIDKARYARAIPVTDRARTILDRHARAKDGLIFGRMDVRGSLYAAALGIGLPKDDARRVGPHDLRHAAITHLANSGAPLASVAFLVGHKTIAMTARYVHADRASAEAALAFRGRPKRSGHAVGTPKTKKTAPKKGGRKGIDREKKR